MNNYLIQITGQVQGVGFRPFIYLLAQQFRYRGWVNNNTTGVYIYLEDLPSSIDIKTFIQIIRKNKPSLAIIETISYTLVSKQGVTDFQITASSNSGQPNLQITPDCAICEQCKQELFDPSNRRYHYPFITCTQCGPRYSILKNIPYDRSNTSMQLFSTCAKCDDEYLNPHDRRFHSQTNSCPHCAITLHGSIAEAVEALKAGKILAIKGIGGFMLMGDATFAQVVDEIRQRKHRPQKPLALMVRNLQIAEKYVTLTSIQKEHLSSTIAPIVLCRRNGHHPLANNVVFDNNFLGILLPYTPLHLLLMEHFDTPLIATSVNLSSNIIVHRNQDEQLKLLSNHILSHARTIEVPQDDSLITFTNSSTPIILRRARGYAPSSTGLALPLHAQPTLAIGSDTKNTFAYWNGKTLILSAPFGNFENYTVQQAFNKHLNQIINTYCTPPTQILSDQNTAYHTTHFANQWSIQNQIPHTKIQHHRAHCYAILGDNNLLHTQEKILGVIWDGMGLGDDGNIWGGEFFTYQHNQMQHTNQLSNFKHLLNNKMAKEPRLSLFSLLEHESVFSLFTPAELDLYRKLKYTTKLLTSSMGRLIDAVSSLLTGICINQFEAEAAMLLEKQADDYLQSISTPFNQYYHCELLNAPQLVQQILQEKTSHNTSFLACKFFNTLVHWIEEVALINNTTILAFSGGVFQNKILIDLIQQNLSHFTLYFHQHLSPNDENIAYGQLLSDYQDKYSI